MPRISSVTKKNRDHTAVQTRHRTKKEQQLSKNADLFSILCRHFIVVSGKIWRQISLPPLPSINTLSLC